MNSTKKKRGRKAKPYLCPWDGKTIDGLYHCHDGRWRMTETGEKFSESDPRLAVLRFRRWQARHRGTEALIRLPDPLAPSCEDDDHQGAVEAILRHELGVGEHRAATDESLILTIPEANDPFGLHRSLPSDAIWAHVRDEIVRRPQYVAQMTGIEQIGYLSDIAKPLPSPTLREVGDLYFTKKVLSPNWRGKSTAFWDEFLRFVEVTKLREMTQEHIVGYGDMVCEAAVGGARKPTFTRQRFDAVKTILNYPPKRGKWAEDCKRAYALCSVLMKPSSSKPDPHPIDRDEFHKLLNAADSQMKALLLTSLNCCMYASEVAALDWSEIDAADGTVVTSREKTGVVRVAVLWARTIEAIRALPRQADSVFVTNGTKTRFAYQTLWKLFSKLRDSAGLTHVQFCHIRDGAYTAACEGEGVQEHHAEMLAGHQTGEKDRYVKRRPKLVSSACAAVERAYFD